MSLHFPILKFLILMKMNVVIIHSSLLLHSRQQDTFSNGNLVDTPGCKIPNINHFNAESSANFIPHDYPHKCTGKPSFINIISNDQIALNVEVLERDYQVDMRTLKCTYREVMKDGGKDSHKYGKVENFENRVPIKYDHIVVYCQHGINGHLHEFVSLFPRKKHLDERYEQSLRNSPPVEPLNIIILHICSLSRLNFLRHFDKTYKYLKDTLDAIELKGYSKISSSSFPNTVPYLTGQHYTKYWTNDVKSPVHFDDSDFIWNHYKEKGYRTLYLEDSTDYGTFNWHKKKGFRKEPVDYYYRPMSHAMEHSNMAKNSEKFCFNSKLRIGVLWDYLKRFTQEIKDPYLKFAFSFVSDITHEYHNYAGHLDTPLLNLLTEFNDSGIMNRSIVIISSDHGIRSGKQRVTLTGAYEDRMPVCFLVFPKWFKSKYPDVYRNLKINENRLTSHFDIHATLFHFLNFDKAPPTNDAYKYGISLFSEIPESRTCEDAGIDDLWCPCKLYAPTIESSIINHVTNLALRKINELVSNFGKCATLSVGKIVYFNSYAYPRKEKYFVDYLFAFLARPGEGVFEASVRYDIFTGEYTVINEMGRVNNHHPSRYCITFDPFISIFCECK